MSISLKLVKSKKIKLTNNSFKNSLDSRYFLYCLKSSINNNIYYIGKTKDLEQTKLRHQSIINKYDLYFQILAEYYSNDLCQYAEQTLITDLKTEFNLLNKMIYL